MRCSRCGTEIKDGDVICAVCGYKADGSGPSGEPPGLDDCTCCGRPVPHESAFCVFCGTPRRFSENVYPSFHSPRRGFIYKDTPHHPHWRRAAAITIFVLTAALLLAATLLTPAARVVYCKQSTIAAADLTSLQPAELTGRSPSDDEFLLDYYTFISRDGRYLYYPERDGDSAVVYRRDLSPAYKDMLPDVFVDSGIGYPFEVTPDNKAVYLQQPGGNLYVNDGSSKHRIASGVSYFELSADGNKLVYTGFDGSIGFTNLWRLSVTKIAANATLLAVSDDFSSIDYDENGSLYEYKIGGEKRRIASGISGFIARMGNGTVYYTKSQEQTIRLADILNDDMKESDSTVKPPDIADYQTTQPAGGSGGTLHEVITDEDAYNAAVKAYTEKLMRDEIRAAAGTFAMDFSIDTLYVYQNGKETKVTDDFAYTLAASGHGLLVYKKAVFAPPETVNLSAIRNIDQLYALFGSFQKEDGNVYAAVNGAETRIVAAEADSLATDNSFVYLPEYGSLFYLDGYDTAASRGILQGITVRGGQLCAPQVIDRDVCTFAADERTGTVFYIKAMQNGGGDLYRNGVKIDSAVSPSGMLLSKDGHTLYYYKNVGQNGGLLMTYFKGDTKRIAYGVSETALINDRLVYITNDGGLYLYTDGEPRLIDNGVTRLLDTQKYRLSPRLDFLSPELLDSE